MCSTASTFVSNADITWRFSISVRRNVPGYIMYQWCNGGNALMAYSCNKNNNLCCIDMNETSFEYCRTLVISAVLVMSITVKVLVISVIAKYPQLRDDRTTLFIISLTLSDLANGCTTMPISAAVCSNATPNVLNMLPYVPRVLYVRSMYVCMVYQLFQI